MPRDLRWLSVSCFSVEWARSHFYIWACRALLSAKLDYGMEGLGDRPSVRSAWMIFKLMNVISLLWRMSS